MVRTRRSERGAVLLVLVVAIVVMLILLGQAAQAWSTIIVREREAEFISRATQIARAIQRYQADNQKLPNTIKQLLEPGPKGNSRYLRRPWKDPLTGKDFVLLWLGPDGSSLFRSDGKPSTSGSFGNAGPAGAGASSNRATSLNLQALTVPLGSPGYDGDKVQSLLDAYRKTTEKPVGSGIGANRPFAANPELNMGSFDTGSDLLETAGLGPVVGVATSMTGPTFLEFKGREDYAGFEISIFTFMQDQMTQQAQVPKRNLWEMPGTAMPDPLSPEGMLLYNTDVNELGGGTSLVPRDKPK